ncbi:MAG TPA: glycosyltransferase family 4 protein [Ignavibacteriaceae bacterium]|nr:glycosyltransferase family 4 protein [Ignavibacteriaceae bacterium]
MKNKNVLMIGYTNYNTDSRIIKEAESLVEKGYKVDFIVIKRKNDLNNENVNGVNVIRVNQVQYRGESNFRYVLSYLEFFFRAFFLTNLLFIKKGYKFIHVNNIPDFFVFIATLPKILGAKIILDIHDPMPITYLTKFQDKKTLLYKILLFQELISAKFSDCVLTVHEPIKEVLIDDGIPGNKIGVVTNFADDNIFNITDNFHLNSSIKLIYHGTIAERFGFEEVVQALNKTNNKEKFYFKIIGEGDFTLRLKQLIKDKHLEKIIDFESRVYPYKELPDFLKNYNVGLVPYRLSKATNYMLPLKMMEYILLGLPVITIPNKTISYYFNKDECFFYNPDEPESLTTLLNTLSENPDLILEKRKKTISLRNRFLWSNEQIKYVNIVEKLIKGE